ncbi:hypothetical protein PC118_g20766 [Phytophthora cactorum]|uniref:Uncharacterized protein n=1 Tax=Phytophthora cactorum TaxID=29920 RepID=A0A8T0Y905_9STRA|nr:hypothetical protein PC112_g21031 [Phytophthora cactorum]KAG2831384.1 hypothetical protein PC113_g20946 [Phytophthora cactorum]KAG2878386.1 hypothetical protein PC114_g23142 [Phytophthora cactorum]KAG2886229.1 hypothetical protein PC115_g20740 [Phytophthora cactorum]KAG2963675.1 hypothetical protein PC118_g20766 [Phytophthora cactorum]
MERTFSTLVTWIDQASSVRDVTTLESLVTPGHTEYRHFRRRAVELGARRAATSSVAIRGQPHDLRCVVLAGTLPSSADPAGD